MRAAFGFAFWPQCLSSSSSQYYTVVFQFAARKVYHEEKPKKVTSLWLEKYHEEKAEKKDRRFEHIPACGLNCVHCRDAESRIKGWFGFAFAQVSSAICGWKIYNFVPLSVVEILSSVENELRIKMSALQILTTHRQPSQPTSKRPVWIFGCFQLPLEQHFPRLISNKEDNLARIRKFSVPFNFVPAIYRFFGSSEWFAFRKFNSFRNLCKLFRDIFVPFATVLVK